MVLYGRCQRPDCPAASRARVKRRAAGGFALRAAAALRSPPGSSISWAWARARGVISTPAEHAGELLDARSPVERASR